MISKVSLSLGACLLAASMPFSTTARAEAPNFSTEFQDTTMRGTECVRAAERALRGANFTDVRLEGKGDDRTAFAYRGNYVAMVDCISAKGMVYFVVAGPNGKQTERYLDSIKGNF